MTTNNKTPTPTRTQPLQRRPLINAYQRIALMQQASGEGWGSIVDERQEGDTVVFKFEGGQTHAIRILVEEDPEAHKVVRPYLNYTLSPAPAHPRPHAAGSLPQRGDLDRLEDGRNDAGQGVFHGEE